MRPRDKKLIIEQLDKSLNRFDALKTATPPTKGWVRAIREALGMTGSQLASRLKSSKQRITRIEQDEIEGKITIKTMHRVAEALDCVFVCGFIPQTSLKQTIGNRAELVAKRRFNRVNQTMSLENQQLSEKDKEDALKEEIEEIINIMPKSLWDENDAV
ncbi:MAG: mobile mystery protein A [Spirochaetes bacterium]|nr:mobile mystery protein A [Spirochaetota bacterium]